MSDLPPGHNIPSWPVCSGSYIFYQLSEVAQNILNLNYNYNYHLGDGNSTNNNFIYNNVRTSEESTDTIAIIEKGGRLPPRSLTHAKFTYYSSRSAPSSCCSVHGTAGQCGLHVWHSCGIPGGGPCAPHLPHWPAYRLDHRNGWHRQDIDSSYIVSAAMV